MPTSRILSRSVEAGREATAQASELVESVVSDILKLTEQQAGAAQRVVEELSQRSDQFREAVEETVRARVADLGLATKDDIRRLESEIAAMKRSTKRAATKASKKSTKKSTAKKGTTKRAAKASPSSAASGS
jgi:polyhydroxyalkanoate synthesis regulator phasin